MGSARRLDAWRDTCPWDLTGRTDLEARDLDDAQSVVETLVDSYDAWGQPEKAAKYRAMLRESENSGASD